MGGEQTKLVGSNSWSEPGIACLEIKFSITTGNSKAWPCPLDELLLVWQYTPVTEPSLLARKSSQHPPHPPRWQKSRRIPRTPV